MNRASTRCAPAWTTAGRRRCGLGSAAARRRGDRIEQSMRPFRRPPV